MKRTFLNLSTVVGLGLLSTQIAMAGTCRPKNIFEESTVTFSKDQTSVAVDFKSDSDLLYLRQELEQIGVKLNQRMLQFKLVLPAQDCQTTIEDSNLFQCAGRNLIAQAIVVTSRNTEGEERTKTIEVNFPLPRLSVQNVKRRIAGTNGRVFEVERYEFQLSDIETSFESNRFLDCDET